MHVWSCTGPHVYSISFNCSNDLRDRFKRTAPPPPAPQVGEQRAQITAMNGATRVQAASSRPRPVHHVACLMECPAAPASPLQTGPRLQAHLCLPQPSLLVSPTSGLLHKQSPNSASAQLGPTCAHLWPARHPLLSPGLPSLSCSKPQLQDSPSTPPPDS